MEVEVSEAAAIGLDVVYVRSSCQLMVHRSRRKRVDRVRIIWI
jgi:hypothetical protein